MKNRYIELKTIKALLAKTGNQCAFPECNHILFNEDNTFVANLCHIEAVSPNGPRYNPNQSKEENSAYNNLLFLCYRHHKETDNTEKYSVEKLVEIKKRHELIFKEDRFSFDDKMISQIEIEFQNYWKEIKDLNEDDAAEMRIKINTEFEFIQIIDEVREHIKWIENQTNYLIDDDRLLNENILTHLKKLDYDTSKFEKVVYYENPFVDRNWEMLNLGFGNTTNKLNSLITQLEIKYYENYLQLNPKNKLALDRLEKAKIQLKDFACNLNHID